MRAGSLLPFVLLHVALPSAAQVTPYSPLGQEADRGLPFPLPQEKNSAGRRLTVVPLPGPDGTREGQSNALTISWDGRVLMYIDSGHLVWTNNPAGTLDEGYVFTTFNKDEVDASSGTPDFSNCFGNPFPRFATTGLSNPPDSSGTYPEVGKGYPIIPGSMGELGLLQPEFLSANLYPVATSPLVPGGQNPYPGTINGVYDPNGAFRVYDAWVTLQDLPKFWYPSPPGPGPAPGRWWGWGNSDTNFFTQYEANVLYPILYPNGQYADSNLTLKRNGRCRLRIVVLVGTNGAKDQIARVTVIEKWKPFTVSGADANFITVGTPPTVGRSVPTSSTMWADNFEPNLSMDGHLMVGKGSKLLCKYDLPARVCFYYNPVAFALNGWRGPYEMTAIYSKRNVVLDGLTIGERYPIARRQLKDYDGAPLAANAAFEGGYTWFDPDGRFVIYSCDTAGVGTGHPETQLQQDGGSNRAHVSIVGSVTGWQMWRIDHAAVNATRHMFTGWDQDSRTTFLRTSSFGFGPGFWEMLKGADGLPIRKDGALRLQLVNNNLLRYYELDLSPYQERDYGFYLPMSEMIVLKQPGNVREVDLSRTPDLSGNGSVADVVGGQLPCEYFELPSNTNNTPGSGTLLGFYAPAPTPSSIHPTWTTSDVVGGPGNYWAKLADWIDGKAPDSLGAPTTTAHLGRGAKRDLDSDVCWGRVGQAMFFKQSTWVKVRNVGALAPKLNPGTSAIGASKALTASLWVRPLQARSAATNLFLHHVRIALQPSGTLTAGVTTPQGVEFTVSGGTATLSSWTHVALTWRVTGTNSSEMRLHVNGLEVASNTNLPFEQLKLSSVAIKAGCLDSCGPPAPLSAVLLLDEVALKNSAMTLSEVANVALLPIVEPTWTDEQFPDGPDPFQLADERVPAGHTYDANLANIGADLFHDVQLSSTRDVSCASCHVPDQAFTDGVSIAIGVGGPLLRNTPTLYNLRYATRQFWDARAVDLEDQALDPVFTPSEMGFDDWSDIVGYIQGDPGYAPAFDAWLGGGTITEAHVRQAIATYTRLVTAGDAPADQLPLDPALLPGKALFEGKARCSGCHSGPGFTDGLLRVTGTFRRDGHDDGAFATGIDTKAKERFRGAFKTPTLRELTRTAPYFHDGHAASLTNVVDFYDAGGVRTDSNGYLLNEVGHDGVAEETNRRLGLTPSEKVQLVAYLSALSAGAAGSSNGPPGWNGAPVVTLLYPTGGPPYPHDPVAIGQPPKSHLLFDVVDARDGQADLDTAMAWTLEVVVGGITYDWTDASLTSIANGWRANVTVAGSLSSGDKFRAADHHGRWGDWVVLP